MLAMGLPRLVDRICSVQPLQGDSQTHVSLYYDLRCHSNPLMYRGLAVEMTEGVYRCPALSDLPTDVVFAQNFPSVVCGHVLDPQPGDRVLDMCAAPGGHLYLCSVELDMLKGDSLNFLLKEEKQHIWPALCKTRVR